MCLVCVLFVVGGWPKSNCQNWTVAKLKVHYIVAHRSTKWLTSLCQIGLGQPTKTNTHDNTRPVIKLHSIKSQPVFCQAPQSIVAQVDSAVGRKQLDRRRGFECHSRICIFHGKDFISSKTQLTLLPRFAYGLG